MSFSGLKTAVLTAVEKVRAEHGGSVPEQTRNDICRAFEDAVTDVLAAKARKALADTGWRTLVVAGGVGANRKLRRRLSEITVRAAAKGRLKTPPEAVRTYFPPLEYCTDNGAMIALAGAMHPERAQPAQGFDVKPRWPLAEIVSQAV